MLKIVILGGVNRRFYGRKLRFTAPLKRRRKTKLSNIKPTIYLFHTIIPEFYDIFSILNEHMTDSWTASSQFGTYRLSAQSRKNLRCSLIQAVSQEEPFDRKPDPWPL